MEPAAARPDGERSCGKMDGDRGAPSLRLTALKDTVDVASIQPFIDSHELRAVIDSINDYAVFLLDPTGKIVTWNRGAQRIKGYAPHEIIGQSYKRFYTKEDLEGGRPDRLLAAAVRDGRVEDQGYRVRKDGTLFWADVVISA